MSGKISDNLGRSSGLVKAAGGGGKIGQVVSTALTTVVDADTANSFEDITGLTVAITPVATSSKILILLQVNAASQITNACHARLMRDSTVINVGTGTLGSKVYATWQMRPLSSDSQENYHATYLDSPSSTSSIAYHVEWMEAESNTLFLNRSQSNPDTDRHALTASTITVMEVLA